MSVTAQYSVTGMTCGHCVAAVTQEVVALPGVQQVDVDLTSGAVTVISNQPLPITAVSEAVDEAGYALTT